MCTCWHPTATSCMHQYSWMICFSEIHLEIAGFLALLQNMTCEKPFEWKTVIVRSKIAFICTWRWKLHWNFYEESIRQTSPTAWWEGGEGGGECQIVSLCLLQIFEIHCQQLQETFYNNCHSFFFQLLFSWIETRQVLWKIGTCRRISSHGWLAGICFLTVDISRKWLYSNCGYFTHQQWLIPK